MRTSPFGRGSGLVALLTVTWALLAFAASTASADSSIEGVWSFNGGKVAIQGQGDGSLAGTVVAPTKFADCTHPVGERMWTAIGRQPDGSYWGQHQWFFASDQCVLNPVPGPTAWRVLRTANGSRFLRACFSEPGSNSQPKIAADGKASDATFGCADSALVAQLPVVSKETFGKVVTLPPSSSCTGRRALRIRIHDPNNDPVRTARVTLRSGKTRRVAKLKRHGKTIVATLNLRGLPAGRFTVKVSLITVLGNHLSGRRTYRRCAKRVRRHGKHHLHLHA